MPLSGLRVARKASRTGPLVAAVLCLPVVAIADARPLDEDRTADYLFQMEQGRFQLGVDSPEKSFIHYENALRLKPDGVEALIGLASIAADRGARELAEVCVTRANALDSANDDVKAIAARLGLDLPVGRRGERGKVSRVSAAYLAQSERDGSGDGRASLSVGERLNRRLFHAFGFDEANRPVALEAEYECSGGLVLESESTFALRAGDKPSADEWIAVRDRGTGAECRVPFRIIGPADRLVAFEARSGRGEKRDAYTIAAGQKLHLQTVAFDAAGNRVYLRRLEWNVEKDGAAHDHMLSRPVTYGSPDYGFEPTGNVFAPPDDDPNVLGAYVVVATEEESDKAARVKVAVVPPDSGDTQATKNPGKIAWTAQTFEEGLSQAAEQGKLLLVEFQATW